MRDAGEIHAVEMSTHVLAKLKAELPAEIGELLAEREDTSLRAKLERTRFEIETREARAAAQCRAAVSQPGRGVGFHQCQKRGTTTAFVDSRPGHLGDIVPADTEHAIEVRLCGTHARDIDRGHVHVWTPNEWEQRQIEKHQAKERAELARLEAALPKEIEQRPR
jgi:hypothetical protein